VLNFDPAIALIGGPEGTEFYPGLVEAAKKLLNPGGYLIVEIGAGQGGRIKTLFLGAGFGKIRVYQDLSGIFRVVKGTRSDG
jgi:release factor glutamine methyltransferase